MADTNPRDQRAHDTDRRQRPRREADQRLHLARELVLVRAAAVVDAADPAALCRELDALTSVVALLRAAEADS